MSSYTTDGGNLALAWMFTTGTAVRPTAWYLALHTADPTVSGAVGEVTTGVDADYIRKSVTFDPPATLQDLSDAAVSFTAASGATTHTVTHASIWTAATAGTCLCKGPLLVARVRTASGVETFNIGDIVAVAS